MSDYPTEKLVSILGLGQGVPMLTDIELLQWIEDFGRWNVQELVAKRQDIRDVITYLRAERSLELAKVTVFVTSDSISFGTEGASYLSPRHLNYVQKMA